MGSMLDGMGWNEGQRGAGEQLFWKRDRRLERRRAPRHAGGLPFATAARPPSNKSLADPLRKGRHSA